MIDKNLICSDYRDALDPATQIITISQLHNISVRAVVEILIRHGYNVPNVQPKRAKTGGRKKNAELIKKLHDYAAKGATAREISEALGYKKSHISKYARENGISLKPEENPLIAICKQRVEMCRELVVQGATIQQVAEALGISEGSARAYCSRHKIRFPGKKKIRPSAATEKAERGASVNNQFKNTTSAEINQEKGN